MSTQTTSRRRTTANSNTLQELLRESTAQLMVDPGRAYQIALTAYGHALAGGDLPGQAATLHAAGQALTFLGTYDAALERLEAAREIFVSIGASQPLARLLNSIGNLYHRTGQTQKALRTYNEGAALLGDDDRDLLGRIRCNVALILGGLGAYQEASTIFLEFLPYYEERDQIQACTILDNLGGLYAELGDHQQATRFLLRALECARASGNLYGQAMTLGNLGALNNEAGRYQEALGYQHEALAICERLGDRDGITRALHNLGVCHELQGNYPEALRYLRRSARQAHAIGNARSNGYTQACIGAILRKTGKGAMAVRTLERAARIARRVEDALLEYNIYNELSHAHEAAGNLAGALACYRRYADMREQVQSEETKRKIAELQVRFDLERAEQEKEIYRLRSEQLEKDLRIKTGELTTMALRLVQRSEMLFSVKEGIAEVLTAQNGSAHPTLRTMFHTMQGSERSDGEWGSFQQQFHRVHPDYIRALSAQFPSLSPTELKICALLKINLNSKEVARLLHVSLRDIENHRYRIRKKLGLASGDNLASFLASV